MLLLANEPSAIHSRTRSNPDTLHLHIAESAQPKRKNVMDKMLKKEIAAASELCDYITSDII